MSLSTANVLRLNDYRDRRLHWLALSRAFRFRDRDLSAVGHLLRWAKSLHAARCLSETGRSGESISRQFEYSSGSAFCRALRNYLRATQTQLVDLGGFPAALGCFLDVCGLRDRLGDGRSVA